MSASFKDLMQITVEAVQLSPHKTNKIAASLAPADISNLDNLITSTNYWPALIEERIGTDTKIGNSSGTLHAETACLLKSSTAKGSSLYITDPPCPNCAKNIAEAGIKNLYIDHKGFEKDFAQRRGDDFQNMSMRIFEAAGINVYEVHRKDNKIIPVLETAADYVPLSEYPIQMFALETDFETEIKATKVHYGDEPFALCVAYNADYQPFILHAQRHPTIGYTHHDDLSKEGKYSFILQPLNRLLMGSKFYGLLIDPEKIFSSRVPTSRELVNLVGANIQTLTIGNMDESRDAFGFKALEQLCSNNIISHKHFS